MAETQYWTTTSLRGKIHFGSWLIEVSVHSLLSPKQFSMAEGHDRGEMTYSMALERRGRPRRREGEIPFQATPPVSYLL